VKKDSVFSIGSFLRFGVPRNGVTIPSKVEMLFLLQNILTEYGAQQTPVQCVLATLFPE
jgi:hypothetical protein